MERLLWVLRVRLWGEIGHQFEIVVVRPAAFNLSFAHAAGSHL
jgi:hypothetical protein